MSEVTILTDSPNEFTVTAWVCVRLLPGEPIGIVVSDPGSLEQATSVYEQAPSVSMLLPFYLSINTADVLNELHSLLNDRLRKLSAAFPSEN